MTDVNNAIAVEATQTTSAPKFEVGQLWSLGKGCPNWFMCSEDADFIYGKSVHTVTTDLDRWGKKDGKYYGSVGNFNADNTFSLLNYMYFVGLLSDVPLISYRQIKLKVGKQYITRNGKTVTIVSDRFNHNGSILFLGLINSLCGQIAVLYDGFGLGYDYSGERNCILDISFK